MANVAVQARAPWWRLPLLVVGAVSLLSGGYLLFPRWAEELALVVARIDPLWLVPVFLLTLFHFSLEPLRWRVYVHDLAVMGRLYRTLFSIFCVTALTTYLIPAKLGIPLRIFLLNGRLQLPVLRATAIMVLDGLLFYGVWGAVAVLLWVQWWPLPELRGWVWLGGAGLGLVFAVVRSRRFRGAMARLAAAPRVPWRRAVTGAGIHLLDVAGHTLRHQALFLALGFDLEPSQVALVTVASLLAGFLSMMPMGLGAYDGVMVFLLSQWGIPPAAGLLVPVVNRLSNVAVSVITGVPGGWFLGVSVFSLRPDGIKEPP